MLYGKYELSHAPAVARDLGKILGQLMVEAGGHWCFAKWWIKNVFAMREGKPYKGLIDTKCLSWAFGLRRSCRHIYRLFV
jgi:hypothetical protein